MESSTMINKYSNGQRLAHRTACTHLLISNVLNLGRQPQQKLADKAIIVSDTPWVQGHNDQYLFLFCHSSKISLISIPTSKSGY